MATRAGATKIDDIVGWWIHETNIQPDMTELRQIRATVAKFIAPTPPGRAYTTQQIKAFLAWIIENGPLERGIGILYSPGLLASFTDQGPSGKVFGHKIEYLTGRKPAPRPRNVVTVDEWEV